MNKLEEIFEKFVQANRLTPIDSQIIKYYFRDENRTIEEILGTADFAGFSDGYQGHSHKYNNNILGLDERLSDAKAARGNLEVKSKIIDGDISQPAENSSEKYRYNLQYSLGEQYKTNQ